MDFNENAYNLWGMSNPNKLSRRRMVKGIVGASMAVATGKQLQAATTQSTVSTDDIGSLERVIGRDFSDDDRKLMGEGLASKRQVLQRLRGMHIGPEVEPAVRFDPRVAGVEAPGGESVCVRSQGETPSYDGKVESLAFATVVELSRLIHARKVTSVELTKMYLDRLKRIGPKLYCVVTLTEELALAQAERADRELAAGKSRRA